MSVTVPKKKPSKQVDLFHLAENITSNIGVGIYIVQRGKFVYISPLYTKITGYSDPELLGKNSLERVHPDDRAMIREKAIKSLKGKFPESYEYRYIRKNGDTMWILEMITSIVYNGQQAALGSFMDITARKKMEETLRQSEERYRTVIEEIEEGYYEVDLHGNFTFVSDSICTTLGYSREELIKLNYKAYIPKEQANSAYQKWREVYQTGKIIKWLPLINIRKDGTYIFVEDSISPLRNKEGKIIGFKGITREVTERRRMEEVIRLSEEKYRTILENMQEGYFEIDLTGTFIFVNDAECRNIGYSREELIGMNHRQFQDEKTAKKIRGIFTNIYSTGQPVRLLEVEIIRKDETKGFNEISISLIRDKEGKPIGFRGITRNTTERRQMEEIIRQSEVRYRTIIEEMEEWYLETDLAGNLLFFNEALARTLKYSQKELNGKNFRSFMRQEQAEEIFKVFHQVYETGNPIKDYPYKFIWPDGAIAYAELSIFPKQDRENKVFGFRAFGHEITERKKAEEQLNYIATHDPLTGLPNRMLFMDRLKMAIAQAKRSNQKLAVMMLDLDHFKNVNDSLGHMVGDQLLKEIGLRLSGRLRQNDTISRLGGDEFIILLPAIERREDSAEVADIILKAFHQPFTCDDNKITSSISIGITIYPDDCQDVDSLLKNADIAMYHVKAHGRNGYLFFDNINIDQPN